MTDTRHGGTARDEARTRIEDAFYAHRYGGAGTNVADAELCNLAETAMKALLEHPDLLQRLHDEQLMATVLNHGKFHSDTGTIPVDKERQL